jgi:hypothetical protein
MTISRKAEIIIAMVVLIVLAIVCKIAYDQHQAVAKAEAVSKLNQDKVAQYDKIIAMRDAADIQQQAVAVEAQAKIKNGADAVRVITKYVTVPAAAPDAPPAAVVVDSSAFTPAEAAKLPPAPSYTVQTEALSIQTAKQLIACDADRKSLDACHADMADSRSAMSAQVAKTDVWEQTAKGGTKTQRFLKVVKCAGSAGAGAYIASAAGQSKWAGLGAVAGVVGCQFF